MSLLTEAAGSWHKSTHSSGDGNCVEVAIIPAGVLVRDSKSPAGPVLDFSREEWDAFVAGVADGEFHLS